MSISLDEIHVSDSIQRKTSLVTLEQNIDTSIREAIRRIERTSIVLVDYKLNDAELEDLRRKYTGIQIQQSKALSGIGYKLAFLWNLPTY